ncbi:uncharacterized protein LOC117587580 [Drosophila guanche]|uniref:Uncharacterized protein n=1 Tax=Drosophila guanche TaxID=7266 RepID=A0A3B0JTV0_DROGU|nr:uncharacterized protein LOC117587580 [Drosophila guanche]SPP85544.1 Hypothetical predicted protein [Drosophila guanche]
MEQNEETLCQNDEEQWSIEDDTLFQPCGLISVSAAPSCKSVFITWNELYLLNFRFKKQKGSNKLKMSRVRIPLPRGRGNHLRSIHSLKYNTILLMSDGQIYCFGSIKALHTVSWLSGVRCFAPTDQGFSVIREREQRLLLETYLDLPGLEKGESTLQHTFDITYDEQNIFQCDWISEKYTLTTLKVSDEAEHFMQRLFGANVVRQQFVHIFSIAGHMFALASNAEAEDSEQAYHIELLCVYACPIHFVRLLPRQNLCLVILSSGSVDIWHVSKLLGIKQRLMHHTGSEWLDYDFDASSENGDLYYTNGEQLVRLRVKYNAQLDECLVQSSAKSVPGIQACTWVSHSEQLVCLSDNNMFYRIAFGVDSEEAHKKTSLLSDFTPAAIQRVRQNTQQLDKYERQPVLLQLAIQREYQKQQLVAVGSNNKLIAGSCKASLKFHRQIPFSGDAVMLLQPAQEMDLHSNCIYAIFKLSLDSCEHLMHSTHWQLLLTIDDHQTRVHVLPELLLNRSCNLVVPLRKRRNERLPELTLKLVAFIELHGHLSAVLIPILVEENSYTYSALFEGSVTAVDLRSDNDLPMYNKKTGPTICHKFRLPNNLTLPQVANLFNAAGNLKENLMEIFFTDIKLRIQGNKDDGEEESLPLSLQCEDPSAIFYFKHHILLNVEPLNASRDSTILNQVMKFQCETERLYGTQRADGSDCGTNIQLRLESQYSAIRKTIF